MAIQQKTKDNIREVNYIFNQTLKNIEKQTGLIPLDTKSKSDLALSITHQIIGLNNKSTVTE